MSRNNLIGPQKRTAKTIMEQQKLPLWKKVDYAKSKIVEFMQIMDGKVYVSFSGGVDSVVLLHLVRSLYPNVIAVFSNTTNEYPEIIKFVKKFQMFVGLNPILHLKKWLLNMVSLLYQKKQQEKLQI